jgi:Holliday junction resolvase RusA-like endonuclease
MEIRFTIPGAAQAQQRAGATVINGHARMFEKAESRNYKALVKLIADEVRPEQLITVAINLAVKVYRQVPKSMPKRKRELALAGSLRPTTRPDVKNIIWGIEDALNGIIWADDSQVVGYDGSGKWYSETPRVEVIIQTIGEESA